MNWQRVHFVRTAEQKMLASKVAEYESERKPENAESETGTKSRRVKEASVRFA